MDDDNPWLSQKSSPSPTTENNYLHPYDQQKHSSAPQQYGQKSATRPTLTLPSQAHATSSPPSRSLFSQLKQSPLVMNASISRNNNNNTNTAEKSSKSNSSSSFVVKPSQSLIDSVKNHQSNLSNIAIPVEQIDSSIHIEASDLYRSVTSPSSNRPSSSTSSTRNFLPPQQFASYPSSKGQDLDSVQEYDQKSERQYHYDEEKRDRNGTRTTLLKEDWVKSPSNVTTISDMSWSGGTSGGYGDNDYDDEDGGSNEDGSRFEVLPTDLNQLLGTKIPGSMIICAPPTQGKTSFVFDLCKKLSRQVDVIYVFTQTLESIDLFSVFLPSSRFIFSKLHTRSDSNKKGMKIDPDSICFEDKMDEILTVHENTPGEHGHNIKAAVIFDDVFLDNNFKRCGMTSLQEYFKKAHRAGIWTIVTVHKLSDLFGGIVGMTSRLVIIGVWEVISVLGGGEMIKDLCVDLKGVRGLDSKAKLEAVWRHAITGKGKAIVIQKGASDEAARNGGPTNNVSFTVYNYKEIKKQSAFVIGHRDLYWHLHQFAQPMFQAIVSPDNSITYRKINSNTIDVQKTDFGSNSISQMINSGVGMRNGGQNSSTYYGDGNGNNPQQSYSPSTISLKSKDGKTSSIFTIRDKTKT